MDRKSLGVMVAAALLVAGCAVTSKAGGTAARTQKGFLGTKKAELDVTTDKAFAGVQQVVIGSFKVGFTDTKKSSAKAGGGFMSSGMGHASAKMELTGVSDELRQQITDAAYADFVAALEQAGYQVVDRAQLLSHEAFAKTKSFPSPHKINNSPFAIGHEITYFAPSSFPALHLFASDGAGLGGGIGSSNPSAGAIDFASKTGIKVLSVNYITDFANADAHGGGFAMHASVAVGQGLSIRPGSGVELLGGQGGTFSKANGMIHLGQPVYSTEQFAEVLGTTSAVNKSLQAAVNVTSVLLGGGSSTSRSFEVRANPEQFQAITTDLLQKSNKKIVDKMASLR